MMLIYSNPYGEVRDLCHAVKTPGGFLDIPRSMLYQMASAVGEKGRKTVLIPIPGHDGTPDYTLDICISIRNYAHWKDIRIIDALRGRKRESLCELKHQGKDTADVKVAFHINEKEIDAEQVATLSRSYDIVLVDNVIDSGRTAAAAEKALGVPCKIITIGSTGQSGLPMPKLHYEIVRLSSQDSDREPYEAVKALADRDRNYDEALRYLSGWDYGAENADAALCDEEGLRATPADPKNRTDIVLLERDGYFLCRAKDDVYDAFYLVTVLRRDDLLKEKNTFLREFLAEGNFPGEEC